MEILLFWSPVINFCRSGPFSFGLFWPAHLPFCTSLPLPPSFSQPLPLYFCFCPLYLFVFRNHFLSLLIHRNSARLLPSRFPLRSSSLISHVASFLSNSLKRIERRRKEAPLCFYGPNFLVQLICGLYAASSHGGYRWWTFVRALSKLFLLKEWRERIISHLLNIRFIHNAAGVFIEQVLLPLLIAAVVAVLVELVSCTPYFLFLSFIALYPPPSFKPHFWKIRCLMLQCTQPAFVAAMVKILFSCFCFIYFFAFNLLLSMSVCRFSPHWAERERLNILFDGLEPERFWIIHSRLLMWLSAAGVSYAPDSGFLLVTESPQTLEFYS